MTTDLDPTLRIRRILVALDASSHSLAALRASARLAQALDAELHGLYVEDRRLLEVVGLPFAREIDVLSGESREMRRPDLERQLRGEAARARRLLQRTAGRMAVRWTFRSTRGLVASELLAAAAEADLVTLGTRSRSMGRGPGSTARTLVTTGTRPVMVLHRDARLGREVFVLYDGSDTAWEALAVAAALSERQGARLDVLVVPGVDEDRAEAVRSWLAQQGGASRLARLRDRAPAHVAAILRREGCGLFVMPRTVLAERPVQSGELLERAGCPVLVVGERTVRAGGGSETEV